MTYDLREIKELDDLILYFSQALKWNIDIDDFNNIDDITYGFSALDIGLKEEAFAKIQSLQQLPPLIDGQKWGIFCIEFNSDRFEVTALRKILSGLVPKKRNSADHAVWSQQNLLFICFWGKDNNRTIGIAHFQDKKSGLPQIKMISCAPAIEDFTQIKMFEDRLSYLKWPSDTSDIESWRLNWSSAFVTGYRQTIQDSSTLTIQLAAEAQNIRNQILDIIEVESPNGYVHLLFDKFKSTLIHDMTVTQFADMYAQTVVYGLFSARCMDDTQDDFSATEAIECIPNTNPFLKSLMRECLGAEQNRKLSFDELEIGNVVDILLHTKIDVIIQDFNRQTGGGREDPVIHFYEEFLTAYDKEQKVLRGVYYTPQPVVNFIVKAVDSILKHDFGIEDGLASTETKTIKGKRESKRKINGRYKEILETMDVPAIQILDPATGTGTFLRQSIIQIYENFKNKHKDESIDSIASAWNKYVPKHLLPRLNGFELMMAPYAVAHMKLAMVLKDTGYNFIDDTRLNVYLTNSLEEAGTENKQLTLFDDPIAIESVEANAVKMNNGINILIGNPPYSGESANKGEWILALLNDYKKEPGKNQKLNEKNTKWINDDYVKFIRYGQDIIKKNGKGILAYINPHGYLDNPTFRGMRWNLLCFFDKIYIVDLHGNAKKKEFAPDGGKDDNVFDIQQGVSINIFVKEKVKNENTIANVYHFDIYGSREHKYNFLNNKSFMDIQFEGLSPIAPSYFFVFKDFKGFQDYSKGFAVDKLFNIYSVGIVTARDAFTIADNREELINRIMKFIDLDEEEARQAFKLGKDVQDWKIKYAKEDLINSNLDQNKITKIAYRLFDDKYTYYTGKSKGFLCRPRNEVMKQFISGNNLGLVICKQFKTGKNYAHVFLTDKIVESSFISNRTSEINIVFPLYIFDSNNKQNNFSNPSYVNHNLNLDIVGELSSIVNIPFTSNNAQNKTLQPIDIFDYVYAILHCPTYRKKYVEFLKIDFPKIPYPKNRDSFFQLAKLGKDLRLLHLFKSDSTDELITTYPNNGDNVVKKIKYTNRRVYINNEQYFDNISRSAWEFQIGSYNPLQKWLKDRKGKSISSAEIFQYQKIVLVVEKTKIMMDEIDSIFN